MGIGNCNSVKQLFINYLLNRIDRIKMRKQEKIRGKIRKQEKIYKNTLVIPFAKMCI